MTDAPVPPQAITDAREAVAAEITYRLDEVPARELVRIAVEGAARAIRADERERCAQLAESEAANPLAGESYERAAALTDLAVLLRGQP